LTSCSSSSNEDEKTDETGNGPSGRLKIWRKSDREGIVPEVFRFPVGGRRIRLGREQPLEVGVRLGLRVAVDRALS
jgi:hypothetical protein